MRRLLSVAVDPEIISLAGGLPATDRLPVDGFLDCLQAVVDREGSRALQYSPMYNSLQEALAGFMRAKGVECQSEQILITSGSQQGLAILSRLFLDPGDPAVVEEVTFAGTQQISAGRGAEIRTVPTDWDTGVDVEALEQAFRGPERPRLAVLMPDFHNPLGVCISGEKRAQIARLATQYNVPVVEDDPYSSLRFAGEPIPPLKAYDRGDHIIYQGSLSKIIAPAVRMGWMIAPLELLPKITVIRESLDLETSGLLQRAVAEFLMRAGFEDHLAKLTATYHERCGALLAALEDQHRAEVGGIVADVDPSPAQGAVTKKAPAEDGDGGVLAMDLAIDADQEQLAGDLRVEGSGGDVGDGLVGAASETAVADLAVTAFAVGLPQPVELVQRQQLGARRHQLAHLENIQGRHHVTQAGKGFDQVFLLQTEKNLPQGRAADRKPGHKIFFIQNFSWGHAVGDNSATQFIVRFFFGHYHFTWLYIAHRCCYRFQRPTC